MLDATKRTLSEGRSTQAYGVGFCSAALVALCGSGVLMPANANQLPRPVVTLACEADNSLCQALVQLLAEIAPSHNYRINPRTQPPQSFQLRLDLDEKGYARLLWQDDGEGDLVARSGLSAQELARRLIDASPSLSSALRGKK